MPGYASVLLAPMRTHSPSQSLPLLGGGQVGALNDYNKKTSKSSDFEEHHKVM
jgi:hypothetical protein